MEIQRLFVRQLFKVCAALVFFMSLSFKFQAEKYLSTNTAAKADSFAVCVFYPVYIVL